MLLEYIALSIKTKNYPCWINITLNTVKKSCLRVISTTKLVKGLY